MFAEFCVFLGNLVSINVSGCRKLSNSALFAILRNSPLLSEIRMESTGIGIGSIPWLDLVIYHQLKSLHLADNSYLRDEVIYMFAFMFPNMQLLDLSSCCGISEDIISEVLKKCPKIQRLNLAFCPQPKLQQLDLERCYGITEKGVRLLVENCTHLREINLRYCCELSTNFVAWMIFSRPSLRKRMAPPHFRACDDDGKLLFRRCLVC
ncbi:F-box/LRR-repeat protein 2-like [Trifolium pratense]|uniref:F-box/LRR-repeat protein 2-like n=1 Tax=Trifolium pratense TaxID=57577 RepID=UPI001E6929DE|nr:F-box/LRR-repeat protein 2-like [Trifolium pratense]